MEWRVSIVASEYGPVVVEADTKEEAINAARALDIRGEVSYHTREISVIDTEVESYDDDEVNYDLVDKTFITDVEKMSDFKTLSMREFLDSYSYITDEEYEATKLYLNWLSRNEHRHAYWLYNIDSMCMCSHCKTIYRPPVSLCALKFCPNCGFIMDLEVQEWTQKNN